jgi:hypothetical protein
MTNLKIHNLHNSEIRQLASRNNLKIYDLSDTCSQIRGLADDEIGNIIGGNGGITLLSRCPCNQCSPPPP